MSQKHEASGVPKSSNNKTNKKENAEHISGFEFNRSVENTNQIELNENAEGQEPDKKRVKNNKRKNQKQDKSDISKTTIFADKKRGRTKNDEIDSNKYFLNSLCGENTEEFSSLKNDLLKHLKEFYDMQDTDGQVAKIRNATSFDKLMESLDFNYLKKLIDEVFYDQKPVDREGNHGEVLLKEYYIKYVEKKFTILGKSHKEGIHRWQRVKTFFRLSDENETEYLNSKSNEVCGIKKFVAHIKDNLTLGMLFKLAGIKENVRLNFGYGNCLINKPVVFLLSNLDLAKLKEKTNDKVPELHMNAGYPSWLHEYIASQKDGSGILSTSCMTDKIRYNADELAKEINDYAGFYGQIQILLTKLSEYSFSERCEIAKKLSNDMKTKYPFLLVLGSCRKEDWIFDKNKIVSTKTKDDLEKAKLEKAKNEFSKKVEEQKKSLSKLVNVDVGPQVKRGLSSDSSDEERKRFLELFFWPLGDKGEIDKHVNEIIDLCKELHIIKNNRQKKSSQVNNVLIQPILSSNCDDKVPQDRKFVDAWMQTEKSNLYDDSNSEIYDNGCTKVDNCEKINLPNNPFSSIPSNGFYNTNVNLNNNNLNVFNISNDINTANNDQRQISYVTNNLRPINNNNFANMLNTSNNFSQNRQQNRERSLGNK